MIRIRTTAVAVTAAMATSGCVTTHYGEALKSSQRDYAVSCSDDYTISNAQFVSFVCTLENTTDGWVTLEVAKVTAKDAEGHVAHLSEPQEIADFRTAYRFEQDKDNHNTQLALAGLTIVGVGAALSSNSNVSTAGAATALGASAVGAGRDVRDGYREVQYGNAKGELTGTAYGREHLMGGPTRIPAKLFVRKRALFEVARDSSPESLEICFKSPREECMNIPVYDPRKDPSRT